MLHTRRLNTEVLRDFQVRIRLWRGVAEHGGGEFGASRNLGFFMAGKRQLRQRRLEESPRPDSFRRTHVAGTVRLSVPGT